MAIPSEWYKQIKEDVVVPAREQNIARKIAAVRGPLGLGVQQYDFDTLSEMSAAELTYAFVTGSEDALNFTRSSVKIPVLHKDFRIDRRDLASAERFGLPLKTEAAQAAAYQVTYKENQLVIIGDSSAGINGLYNAAGNSESTALDFGTYGNAIKKIRAAMSLLMADKIYPPYNLLLHPTQFSELYGSIDTASGGSVDEAARVKAMIGGDIIVCPYLTDGTGLLLATPSQRKFEIIIAQDLTVEADFDRNKNVVGKVFECLVPVVYDSNAICKLTNI
jgi:uncharacterized linocin/CFP29 family protein